MPGRSWKVGAGTNLSPCAEGGLRARLDRTANNRREEALEILNQHLHHHAFTFVSAAAHHFRIRRRT